jgi:hypothetical protein
MEPPSRFPVIFKFMMWSNGTEKSHVPTHKQNSSHNNKAQAPQTGLGFFTFNNKRNEDVFDRALLQPEAPAPAA